MSASVRLFVAFEIPAAVREACAAVQSELAVHRDVVVEAGQDLHLTLAFLGNRSSDEIEALLRAIDEAAAIVPPQRVVLSGPTGYRELARLAMLVFDDDGNGQALWRELNARLAEAVGYEPRRAEGWLPHITIARFTRRPHLDPPLEQLPSFSPVSLGLFETVPGPRRPRYRPVGKAL